MLSSWLRGSLHELRFQQVRAHEQHMGSRVLRVFSETWSGVLSKGSAAFHILSYIIAMDHDVGHVWKITEAVLQPELIKSSERLPLTLPALRRHWQEQRLVLLEGRVRKRHMELQVCLRQLRARAGRGRVGPAILARRVAMQ